ncbi:MAG TPA: NAD-dependent epimerase/dehydratase family protein [Ignavibacteria bacterium]|nr:NAD-dependent epimerase/dehydratase family protein [Ignavibacteria bacterium]
MKKLNKNCIVYGGGGFIGSHLCEELLNKGYDVTLFDKKSFSRDNIEHIEDKIKIIEGDFNNEIDIKNSLKGMNYVFHLVSSTLPASSNENMVYDVESNLISSIKLFKLCLNVKINKLVFLSSGGTVYGIPDIIPVKELYFSNPICSYGIVKRTIEEYLFLFSKISGLNYNVFRLANPYGEKQNPHAAQGAVAVFINKAINNETIEIWGDGEVVRDYIYIKDAVSALTASIITNSRESVFNLSSGKGYSLNQIIDIIKKVSGKEVKIKYKSARNIDVPVSVLDNELLKKTFNWKPEIDIEEGINKTYHYLLNQNV